MITDPKIMKRLAGVREVPTLPEVMEHAMVALSSDDASASDLADILSTDQALCSKVLKVANSAFFAQRRQIYDIGDAIVLLGFDHITQITLATSVFSAFGPIQSSEMFNFGAFWEHSIATAFSCKFVAKKQDCSSRQKVLYTAGLLHDVGKLLLLMCFPREYATVLEKVKSDHLFLDEAEQLVLGFTHCDVGEWICDRWNFPERLVRIIGRHHADPRSVPREDSEGVEAAMVSLANIISNRLEIGSSGNRKAYALDLEDYDAIKIGPDCISEIEQKLENSRGEIGAMLKTFLRNS